MSPRTWFYDRDGTPLDAKAWAALLTDPTYVMIDAKFVGPFYVSTRWTGVDNPVLDGEGEPRPPLVFETAAFQGRIPVEVRRYPNETAARAGHADVVRRLRRWRQRRTLSLVIIGAASVGGVAALVMRWWS